MRINSNISSLRAQRNLGLVQNALQRVTQRLSSGLRINRAGDDASGLAISNGLESSLRGLRKAVQNLNESKGFLSTAEGALATQIEIIQRMRELSLQAANGAIGSKERQLLQTEFSQLHSEFERISSGSQFNGINLLDGTITDQTLQVGYQKGNTIDLSIGEISAKKVFYLEVEQGTGSFTSTQEIDFGSNVTQTEILDINGDGFDEFYVRRTGTNEIYTYINDGEGNLTLQQTINIGVAINQTDVVDVNNDGINDIISRNSTSNSLSIYLGSSSGSFTLASTLNSGAYVADSKYVDFDNDGNIDIVQIGDDSVRVDYGDGNGTFGNRTTLDLDDLSIFGTGVYLDIGDIDGDGLQDIIATTQDLGVFNSYTFINQGNRSFTETDSIGLNDDGTTFTADINNDGEGDLISLILGGQFFTTHINDGDNTFTYNEDIAERVKQESFVDFNGDGFLDVVTGDSGGGNVKVYHGDASGDLNLQQTINVGGTLLAPTLTDIDNDGYLDFIVNSTTGDVHVGYGRADGSFEDITDVDTFSFGDLVQEATDINGDGFKDLISEGKVLLGSGDREFETTLSSSIAGLAYRGNFNGDDLEEMIVRNPGTRLTSYLQNTITIRENPNLNIGNQESAQDLLEVLDNALSVLLERRSDLGALTARLDFASQNATLSSENLSAARSQIVDADFAIETAEMSRVQILQQSGLAVLQQANVEVRMVLNLLGNLG